MAHPFSLSLLLAATINLFVLMAVPSPARAAGDSFESGTFAALPWEISPVDAWQVVAGDAADG
ncbi:MAG: hypothetical protein HYV63_28875, partial [Candidatus Schekmanbacteria bacterium]|nr:hypothetical protein [Candidatus Schekmanbacteria bacterium]